ncbi:MAG TPA: hypothetical protein VNA04_15350 [Thermoanaerobaculia bacterium]|nr:hypothetical protein [Thermoanaerobaculia bacterium]
MRCTISVNDSALLGHAAELSIVRKVVVHDSRAVNSSEVVLRRKVARLEPRLAIDLHRAALQVFSYSGPHIDIEVHSILKIDDGFFFDTTISREEQMALSPRPHVSHDAKEIVEPHDAFDFIRNLAAIPPLNRAITMALVFLGGAVIAVNTWVGVHDQLAPEPMVWFYTHFDSDGDGESPLQKSLMGSGVIGAAIWYGMKRQLRKYMTFELHGIPARICRGDSLRAAALLRGRSRVPLENVTLRVVACNMELGQYKRGSGTKERTVSFTEPVRAVILYDHNIPLIPAGAPVQSYIPGEIRFEPMFRALYPQQMAGSRHGLSLYWEVQLIHDDFIDQELIGPVDCFPWKDFLEA